MPKLVLEIKKLPTRQVSLCYPTSVAEPYTALSYCWGGEQPYQTTKARIDSGNFHLDWNRLPKTIQDAVRVTDELGIRFLWVDSLCIPQDDEDEKEKQIALMPQIYSKAALTIVASRAQRAEDGFLQDRDMSSMPNLVLMAKLPFHDSSPFHLHGSFLASPDSEVRKNQDSVYIAHWWPDDDREPLDFRGWTLQERYLSSRILEYSTMQVSFRCSSSNSDQDTCTDGWHVAASTGRPLLNTLNFQRLLKEHNPMEYEEAKEDFYDVVEAFTKRQLSLREDRILAISGIANSFQSL